MTIFGNIKKWVDGCARVFAREWSTVLHDQGVMIFFVFLPLVYPIAYTLIYNPELLREIHVVVVDNDRTEASRKLVRDAGASPSIDIRGYAADMAEAKEALAEREAYAILLIPRGYGRDIVRFEPTTATLYCEMSLLLRYRDLVAAAADVQMKDIREITAERARTTGVSASSGMPFDSISNFMGDTQQGFASFVMPGIVVLILQQSMVLGIAMLGGTSRERRRRNGGIDPLMVQGVPHSATVTGRTMCYFVFYIAPTMYLLHWIPEMFNLPHEGSAVQYLLFAVPLVLGSALFGQTLNYFVRDREAPFIIIVLTSVIFLFLSGFTWPRYAFPAFWQWVGDFVPAVWGVEGYIRISGNGATLAQNSYQFLWLWLLVVLYFCTSVFVLHLVDRQVRRGRF